MLYQRFRAVVQLGHSDMGRELGCECKTLLSYKSSLRSGQDSRKRERPERVDVDATTAIPDWDDNDKGTDGAFNDQPEIHACVTEYLWELL